MKHYVRVVSPISQVGESKDKDSFFLKNKSNLEQNHKRYARWKWYVIGLAILTRIVLGVFLFLEYHYEELHQRQYNKLFILIIAIFDLFYFIGYVACLILVI